VDAIIRKYDSDGRVVWTIQFGTSVNDGLSDVALDAAGNVIVGGYTEGTLPGQTSSGGRDTFIRIYDSDGSMVWTLQFGTPSTEYLSGLSLDGADNVIVVGHTDGALPGQTSSGGRDAFVMKLSTSYEDLPDLEITDKSEQWVDG